MIALTKIHFRDKLVNLDAPTGLRFDGGGFASMDTHSHRFHDRFSITMKFKTYSEDGILFLVEHSPVCKKLFSCNNDCFRIK